MKKYFRATLFFIPLFVFLFYGYCDGPGVPKLFICHSYAEGEGCGSMIQGYMMPALEKLGWVEGKTIEIYYFYMDTLMKYQSLDQMKQRGKLALEKIHKAKPDVLLVLDDTAFAYVALPLAKTDQNIVFSGVNVPPEYYDERSDFMISRTKPGYNITGIKEQSFSFASCRLAKEILPHAQKLAVITSVALPYVQQTAQELKDLLIGGSEKFLFEVDGIYTASTWEEYQKYTLQMNQRDDIDVIVHFMSVGLKDKQGKSYSDEDVWRWILAHEIKPEFATWSHFMDYGVLCGTGADSNVVGIKMARQIDRILHGERPGDIPIEAPKEAYVSINKKRAEQFGIKIPFHILGAARFIYLEMRYGNNDFSKEG